MFFRKNQLQFNTAGEEKSTDEEKKKLLSSILLRRGVGLGAALALLVILIIAGTVAWYTRIANVTGITMKAAEFDFAANYTADDFIISVSNYRSAGNEVAPGTGGIIPLRLSTTSSLDINYAVNLNVSVTAPEFQQRLRFYYYTKDDNDVYTKHYIQPGSPDIVGFLPAVTEGATESVGYEFVYWEWIYDFDPSCYFDFSTSRWANGSALSDEEKQALREAYDMTDADNLNFDTRVALHKYDLSFTSSTGMEYTADTDAGTEDGDGRYAYQKAMEVKLEMSGVQATPVSNEQYEEDLAAGRAASGTTVFAPAGSETVVDELSSPGGG